MEVCRSMALGYWIYRFVVRRTFKHTADYGMQEYLNKMIALSTSCYNAIRGSTNRNMVVISSNSAGSGVHDDA